MPRWGQAPSQVFSDCLTTEMSNLFLSTDWKRAEGSLSSSFCQERSSNSQVRTKSQLKQKPENVFLVYDFMRMPCTLFANRNAALQKSLFMTPYLGKSVMRDMKNKTPHIITESTSIQLHCPLCPHRGQWLLWAGRLRSWGRRGGATTAAPHLRRIVSHWAIHRSGQETGECHAGYVNLYLIFRGDETSVWKGKTRK